MFDKILRLALPLLIITSTLLFWTFTPNFFTTAKEVSLLIITASLLTSYSLTIVFNKKLTVPGSGLTLPLVIFIIAIIASLVVNPEGRPEAMAGKALILLLLPIIALLILTTTDRNKLSTVVLTSLSLSSFALALHSLLSLTLLSNWDAMPDFMQNKLFTPTGSYITTLTMIILGGSLSANMLSNAKNNLMRFYLITQVIISSVATVAIVSLMLPGSALAPTLIPYQASWAIALDALKSLRSLLFGIGISNYGLLYTAVRPISLNLTPLWNTTPTFASSELLTLLPTAGVTTTASILYLMFQGLLNVRNNSSWSMIFLISSLALVLTPSSHIVYLLFFLSLVFLTGNEPRTIGLSRRTSLTAGIAGTLIATVALALLLRPTVSERYISLAQKELLAQNAQGVYQAHIQALRWYPRMTNYHLSFANINLNIASALSRKEDLTESDRNTISQLIQQAIQSARTGISLRPNDSNAYLTLANIYQNLVNVATGAENFAIQAYTQAIARDRANPVLRVQLGGLLTQLGNNSTDATQKSSYLSRANQELLTAIQIKRDYSNAYYNLARLEESQNNFAAAMTYMEKTLKYLPSDSNDYEQVRAELETLRAKVPAPSTPTPDSGKDQELESLSTPSPLPSPLEGGPLDLPISE